MAAGHLPGADGAGREGGGGGRHEGMCLDEMGGLEFIDTLGAAYAEAGDFMQATNYERQAMARVLTSDPAKETMMQHLLIL